MRLNLIIFIILSILLTGCGFKSWHKGGIAGGKPYTVRGKTYYPLKSAKGFIEEGIASWYGPGFHGKKTSNGEKFNQNAMTAAHKLLPFNTKVSVTNLSTGKTIVVRINDRGPFVNNRVIDLAKGAAIKLGIIGSGTARVLIKSLE